MFTNVLTLLLTLFTTLSFSLPQTAYTPRANTVSGTPLGPDSNGKYEISAPGIRALFVPYGAAISNLFINDTHGIERDIVGGFDNASYYHIDRQHPHFGGIPGRYANRIKNSSFVIDGETFNILPNENPTPDHPDGVDTLHGGPDGWDWRNWTIVSWEKNSITWGLTDSDGNQGFPGEVVSYVTYEVGEGYWDFRIVALATTKKTPIMLSSHTYWNLDGFQNPTTPDVLNHSLWLPYGGQRVGTDSILIPDGTILPNVEGSVNDFWSKPKQLGANFSSPDLLGECGAGCLGYDTCFLTNRLPTTSATTSSWLPESAPPVARLRSPWSGIQLDIYTDQDAFQVYTCSGQNGSMALKNTQGFFSEDSGESNSTSSYSNSSTATRERTIQKYGCIVMEVQDWIDAINNPEWGREEKQIYGPGSAPYQLRARYVFSLNGTAAD